MSADSNTEVVLLEWDNFIANKNKWIQDSGWNLQTSGLTKLKSNLDKLLVG